jgi:hypothetical protein
VVGARKFWLTIVGLLKTIEGFTHEKTEKPEVLEFLFGR